MKADQIGIRLTAVFKGIKEKNNSDESGFSPTIIHDERRI